MAILQISRIQHRRGLQENLPQLSSAELGWSIDQQRLFIGNGTTSEGAPSVGNTEILTEHSDLIGLSGAYIFKGEEAGYTVTTGPSILAPAQRAMQDKFDDIANARDFGVVGDGITDDTDAINRAIVQLHKASVLGSDARVRRTLHLPAGTYLITAPIKLLPYVKLRGDGKYATIIKQANTVPTVVIETTDSAGDTGLNMGLNAAILPGKNEVEGMTLQNTTNHDIMLVDSADATYIRRVRFEGSQTSFTTADQLKSCLLIKATVQTPTGIVIEDSDFSQQTFGVSVTERANNLLIFASNFDYLYRGIVVGQITNTPTYINNIRIAHSQFDQIGSSAIIGMNGIVNIVSSFNIFKNVANNLTNTATAPVISFTGKNCYSIADVFDRTNVAAYPTVDLNGQASFATLPDGKLLLGKSLSTGSQDVTLADGQVSADSVGIIGVVGRNAVFNYIIERTGIAGEPLVRNGSIKVAANSNIVTYTDEYVETDDLGVTLIPTYTAGLIELMYQSDVNSSYPVITLKTENTTLL